MFKYIKLFKKIKKLNLVVFKFFTIITFFIFFFYINQNVFKLYNSTVSVNLTIIFFFIITIQLLHIFMYFTTIYIFSKYTSVIKFFWIRVFTIFWCLEFYTLGVFLFLFFIAPNELLMFWNWRQFKLDKRLPGINNNLCLILFSCVIMYLNTLTFFNSFKNKLIVYFIFLFITLTTIFILNCEFENFICCSITTNYFKKTPTIGFINNKNSEEKKFYISDIQIKPYLYDSSKFFFLSKLTRNTVIEFITLKWYKSYNCFYINHILNTFNYFDTPSKKLNYIFLHYDKIFDNLIIFSNKNKFKLDYNSLSFLYENNWFFVNKNTSNLNVLLDKLILSHYYTIMNFNNEKTITTSYKPVELISKQFNVEEKFHYRPKFFIFNIIIIIKFIHIYVISVINMLFIFLILNKKNTSFEFIGLIQQNIIILSFFFISNYLIFIKYFFKRKTYGIYKNSSIHDVLVDWSNIINEIKLF